MPPKLYSKDKFLDTVKRMSIFDDSAALKQGTIPDSVVSIAEAIGFQYAYEFEQEIQTLKGPVRVRPYKTIPVVLAKSGALLAGSANKEEEERVMRFIEANFAPRTILQRMRFEQKLLRKIIDTYHEVAQVEVVPSTEKSIDKLSATGRGVTASKFWDEYGGEELLKVKTPLSDLPEPPMVGFKEKGVVTLYGRSLEFAQQVEVLSFVAGKIIAQYSRELAFQITLR